MDATSCQNCGAALTDDAREGICPKCLFAQGAAGVFTKDSETPPDQAASAAEPELGTEPQLPRSFGDYELLEEIARGGMGIVYRARHASLDRIVAVKMLLFGPFSSPEFVKRFRAEASAAASLQHPNIVAIHEVGVHQGQHYFAMDYIEGQSLAKSLVNGPLCARTAAHYVKIVAEAIHYAHERGILHRDLKPSNVLIDSKDQPRVMDFGLARRLDGNSELTISGQVLGSPNYMPPEQATGRGKVSRRSDVYSLGAMLYHLLAGRPPFVGDTMSETLRQVENEEPVGPRLLNPSVRRDLETICLKCLQKEPDKRYPSAQALADELDRFLEDEPIEARPITWLEKIWRWGRRKPALAGSIAAAAVLLILVLIGGPVLMYRINEQRHRAEDSELTARQNQYASDMKMAQHELAQNNLGRASNLLNQHRPEKGDPDLRGWEWQYLWQECRSEALFSLCARPNPISALALSPHGRWLAVGEFFGGGVSIWDLQTHAETTALPAGAHLTRLTFSPRGDLLALSTMGDVDSTNQQFALHLWNPETKRRVAELSLNGPCMGLSFSGDGRTLVSSTANGEIALWQIPEGIKLASYHAPQPAWEAASLFAVAPDLSVAAHATPDDRVRVIELATGRERWSKKTSEEGVKALAFSPDSTILASGAGFAASDIRLWDTASGDELKRLSAHTTWVGGLVFWPDGKRLASASADQTIRIWDLSNLADVPAPRVLRGHKLEVWRLALLPDNRTLISACKDGSVFFWDTGVNDRPPAVMEIPASLSAWTFTTNREAIITLDRDGKVGRWSGRNFEQFEPLLEIGTNFHHRMTLFSKDAGLLATGAENILELWNLQKRTRFHSLKAGSSPRPVAFLAHGTMLVTYDTTDRTHQAWDVSTGLETRRWQGPAGVSWSGPPVFSADERWCLTLAMHGSALMTDMLTGEERRTNLNYRHIMGSAFSPDGSFIAAASSLGSVRFWDRATFRPLGPPLGGFILGGVSVAFSEDGTRLAVGSGATQTVKLWDVKTGREVIKLPTEGSLFNQTKFSPDGSVLGSMTRSGRLHLWRAPTWTEIEEAESLQRKAQFPRSKTKIAN